jgi:hypothetical protein
MAEKNRRLNGIGILIMLIYGFVCLMSGYVAGYMYKFYHSIWYIVGITLILVIGFNTLFYFIVRNRKYSKVVKNESN